MSKIQGGEAIERSPVHGNEVPAIGPERYGKSSLGGVKDMRERIQ